VLPPAILKSSENLNGVFWPKAGFLGLLDPDPLVGGTDPDPDPSIYQAKK
jgi:hypothetical protein